ncbi:hypothetical protein M0804_014140 [Polistes exclamans]|nr:hypothetical protein M0804_014140 [Polistes exclamans]
MSHSLLACWLVVVVERGKRYKDGKGKRVAWFFSLSLKISLAYLIDRRTLLNRHCDEHGLYVRVLLSEKNTEKEEEEEEEEESEEGWKRVKVR